MSLIGYILLLSGWLLVIASLLLLTATGSRLAFVVAGLFVEFLGLALVALHYSAQLKGAQ